MQSLSVRKGKLKDKVEIPPSKSYANRALILAAISKTPITLINLPAATDVENLLRGLELIGIKLEIQESHILFSNSFPACESGDKFIDVGDGGTTARFLAALCLLGSKEYSLKLGGKLSLRPWDEFLTIAKSLKAKAILKGDTLIVQGPAQFPPTLEIDCSRTTQFATAFSLLSSVTGCEISPINLEASKAYWDMTNEILKCTKYNSVYSIPLDWSSASYPLAFGALNQDLIVEGLRFDAFQADARFLSILREFKCVEETPSGVRIHPVKKSHSVTVDIADSLDLAPALSYFLAHIEGTHHLLNVENLVHKESDRLHEIIQLLSLFDRRSETNGKKLTIYGSTKRLNRQVDLKLPHDHRMVMTGTLFLLHHGGGTLSPQEAVKKSFPNFYSMILD